MSNPNQVFELEVQKLMWDCALANRDNPLEHRIFDAHVSRLRDLTRQSLLAEIAKRGPKDTPEHSMGNTLVEESFRTADGAATFKQLRPSTGLTGEERGANQANAQWRKLLTELAGEGDKSNGE